MDTDWKETARMLAQALDKMPCISPGHVKVKDEALQAYYKAAEAGAKKRPAGWGA